MCTCLYYVVLCRRPVRLNTHCVVCFVNFQITLHCFHLCASTNVKLRQTSFSYNIDGEIIFQKVVFGYILNCVQNVSSKNIFKHTLLHINLKKTKVTRLGFQLGAPTTRKVVTKTCLYKIYREILFQKAALGYLLHFVQNGSSKLY